MTPEPVSEENAELAHGDGDLLQEDRLEELTGDRGRDLAAEPGPLGEHDDDHPGVLDRRECGEPGVVLIPPLPLGVALELPGLRRARLAGDLDAGHRGRGGGAVVDRLDLRHLGAERILERLHGTRELSMTFAGVDPIHDPIPVRPGAHYHMGGIDTDLEGKTVLDGLYAAGECACVSCHGANRLGGNALMETITFGKRSGRAAADWARSHTVVAPPASALAGAERDLRTLLDRAADLQHRLWASPSWRRLRVTHGTIVAGRALEAQDDRGTPSGRSRAHGENSTERSEGGGVQGAPPIQAMGESV